MQPDGQQPTGWKTSCCAPLQPKTMTGGFQMTWLSIALKLLTQWNCMVSFQEMTTTSPVVRLQWLPRLLVTRQKVCFHPLQDV